MRCSAYKLKDMMKCERFLLIISRIMLYTFAVALVCACGVWLFGKFPIMILVLVGHYIIIEWCVLPLLVIWEKHKESKKEFDFDYKNFVPCIALPVLS